ncbi:MAG: NUDIX hydrolase domain-like protein [Linnemannia gamsii]|nr:MAG: NUDIX hydrolase domain-like protein [Linnemannia gamsii]
MTTQQDPVIQDIKQTADTLLGKGRWLSLHQVQFQDPSGTQRGWEVCRRIKPDSTNASTTTTDADATTNVPNDGSFPVDAVDIITIIKNTRNKATHVVLVTQYRPALAAYCLEFPSGLIDAGEVPQQAALRELKEETGFSADFGHSIRVINVGVPVAYEPGLTGSCSRVALIEIVMDEDDLLGPNSPLRKAKPEDDEWSLQVLVLPLQGLYTSLLELQDKVGGPSKLVLDSRLYAWAFGREFGYS